MRSQVRLTEPPFPVLISGMFLKQLHYFVVVTIGDFLMPNDPVVELPVIAGTVDQLIILIKLSQSQLIQVTRGECAII